MTRALVQGLYEEVVTDRLDRALAILEAQGLTIARRDLEPAESHLILARHMWQILVGAFRALPGENAERLEAQIQLANTILEVVRERVAEAGIAPEDAISSAAQELHSILPSKGPLSLPEPARPGIPLSASGLLVNARDEHRIGVELAKELQSADRVDLLCSFVKWSGLRCVEEGLTRLGSQGKRLRVMTTTYMGATERQALDRLAKLGAEIRVSYNTQRTRLHAKAWLFRRDTGYDTAYIGSSNLSSSALVDGREWNVRLSRVETPQVVEKFEATFEAYWEDAEFEPYDPDRDAERFDRARRSEQGGDVSPRFHLDRRAPLSPPEGTLGAPGRRAPGTRTISEPGRGGHGNRQDYC